MKKKLHIIKIGGNIIDDHATLEQFIGNVSSFTEPFILVHGGGKMATAICEKLGITTQMIEGRRITDKHTLNVIVMVYAGLINKTIVAGLQSKGVNAIGLCGADANIIQASLRSHATIDYGKVGDIQKIDTETITAFLKMQLIPVIAPVTHDNKGGLLNTNADSIASSLAVTLSDLYEVHLHYCFEKNGVLLNVHDEQSVIPEIDQPMYEQLKSNGVIHSGMIPKLDNAFLALANGVAEINLINALQLTSLFNQQHAGTKLVK